MLYGIRTDELRRLRDAGHPAFSLIAYGERLVRVVHAPARRAPRQRRVRALRQLAALSASGDARRSCYRSRPHGPHGRVARAVAVPARVGPPARARGGASRRGGRRHAPARRARRRCSRSAVTRPTTTSSRLPRSSPLRGIEVIRVERGGEVTYHGPGQLVAYPIVRLADRGVLLRPFVRALEAAMADTAASYGVAAGPRAGHPGCWVDAGRAVSAEARGARPAGREGRHLPRHRAERDDRPGRLRAHRPLRHGRASTSPRSPASWAGRARPRHRRPRACVAPASASLKLVPSASMRRPRRTGRAALARAAHRPARDRAA